MRGSVSVTSGNFNSYATSADANFLSRKQLLNPLCFELYSYNRLVVFRNKLVQIVTNYYLILVCIEVSNYRYIFKFFDNNNKRNSFVIPIH